MSNRRCCLGLMCFSLSGSGFLSRARECTTLLVLASGGSCRLGLGVGHPQRIDANALPRGRCWAGGVQSKGHFTILCARGRTAWISLLPARSLCHFGWIEGRAMRSPDNWVTGGLCTAANPKPLDTTNLKNQVTKARNQTFGTPSPHAADDKALPQSPTFAFRVPFLSLRRNAITRYLEGIGTGGGCSVAS